MGILTSVFKTKPSTTTSKMQILLGLLMTICLQVTIGMPQQQQQPASASICKTTLDSKDPGVECKFPFIYENVTYTGCPIDLFDESKRWCSTETDSSGKHVSGKNKYGYCLPECPAVVTANDLNVVQSASQDKPKDICNFNACNELEFSVDVNSNTIPFGECKSQGDSGEHFCFVNEDSVCPKTEFIGKPGTYASYEPCKSHPGKRFWGSLAGGIARVFGGIGRASTAVIPASQGIGSFSGNVFSTIAGGVAGLPVTGVVRNGGQAILTILGGLG